ncbi:MAG TPA: hypothetical protein VGB74_08060, partial [Actinoplanes sp.]
MRATYKRGWGLLAAVGMLIAFQPQSGAYAETIGEVAPPAGVWTDAPVGFASVAGNGLDGTTGGAAGQVVTASTLEQLTTYAAAVEPLVVRVRGTINVDPFGAMIKVASDKTIIGLGSDAELVGGGLYLNQVHNVIVRNLT